MKIKTQITAVIFLFAFLFSKSGNIDASFLSAHQRELIGFAGEKISAQLKSNAIHRQNRHAELASYIILIDFNEFYIREGYENMLIASEYPQGFSDEANRNFLNAYNSARTDGLNYYVIIYNGLPEPDATTDFDTTGTSLNDILNSNRMQPQSQAEIVGSINGIVKKVAENFYSAYTSGGAAGDLCIFSLGIHNSLKQYKVGRNENSLFDVYANYSQGAFFWHYFVEGPRLGRTEFRELFLANVHQPQPNYSDFKTDEIARVATYLNCFLDNNCPPQEAEYYNIRASLPWKCNFTRLHLAAADILSEHLRNMDGYTVLTEDKGSEVIDHVTYHNGDVSLNFDVQFTWQMSREELEKILYNFGTREVFCFRQFGDTAYHSFTRWVIFEEEKLAPAPPALIAFIADVCMGPYGAVYGWTTGMHWQDGHKLSGWEHVLACLDVVPVSSAVEKLTKNTVTRLIIRKGSEATLDLLMFARVIPDALWRKADDLSARSLAVLPVSEAEGALVNTVNGSVLATMKNGAVTEIKAIAHAAGQLVETLDNVSVVKNGTTQASTLGIFDDGTVKWIEEIAEGGAKATLLARLNDFHSLRGWVATLNETSDALLIEKFGLLDEDYLGKLNVDIVHERYGNGIKELLKENPDDLIDIWKRLKDDAAYSWEIKKTGGSRWEKWGEREFFREVTGKGKKFEIETCLNTFRDRTSAKYLELKTKVADDFAKNLDEYDLYSQVQLYYDGDNFFVADQIFIKYDMFGDVEDMIVLENKLSSGTPLTAPQSGAKLKTSYKVRSQVEKASEYGSGRNLTHNKQLIFEGDIKWYKVHDGSDGETISGIIKL